MEPVTSRELKTLAQHAAPYSISILMPIDREAPKASQDPIRFKNLLRQAEQHLVQAGLRKADAQKRLQALRALPEDYSFWQRQGEGLGIFLAGNGPQFCPAPFEVAQMAVVGERFHLKPLLPMLDSTARFHILALSQNTVRLFRASRYDLAEVELSDVPSDFDEAMRFVDSERHLEFHTGTPGQGSGAKRAAAYHGQGTGGDDREHKTRLLEYCQMIDRGVRKALSEATDPLVLAGNEPLLSLYRQANDYRHLSDDAVHGNPEAMSDAELHEQAVQLLGPLFEERRTRDADRYRQVAGSEHASNELATVLPAAHFSQIETLFVSLDDHVWGAYGQDAGITEQHEEQQPTDQDLLNVAALATLANGGRVHAVPRDQMPDEAPAAAIFRFPSS